MSDSVPRSARIGVVKPCCIGDCVMALPAIAAMSRAFPNAELDVWVGNHSRAVFALGAPGAALHTCPETLSAREALALGLRWRRRRYETLAILDRSRWLRIAARFSGARHVATARADAHESRHERDVYLDVVRALGIAAPPALPHVTVDPAAEQRAATLLAGIPAGFVTLHPGGAENPGVAMHDKRWPRGRWEALARVLEARGQPVVLTGGPGDRDDALRVADDAGLLPERVLAGRTDLETVSAVLARARLHVGIDTGLSHLAAAAGTPVVAIFGPTNPRRYRPLGPLVRVVAPDASWELPDVDLRRGGAVPAAASTSHVELDAVLAACDELLGSGT